jgi:hypothetical protein
MSLCTTFIEAELNAGKTTAKIIKELSEATGYAVDHSTLFRWKSGERNPRPEVRRIMLRKALPYLLGQSGARPTGATLRDLVEALL